MTKSEQKPKLQIPTRSPKPKGDMFANLRTREQIETVPFEELVAPLTPEHSGDKTRPNPAQDNPTQPVPTQPNQPQSGPAPVRDFNRRANSLERDALPSGLFPGTSKKLYDALYLRTRGAITPVRSVQATKRELMTWSGIRSKNTIAINLKILLSVGLIKPEYDPGNHEGSVYEVYLPEELPTQPNPTRPNPTQKLGPDPTQLSGWVGSGKTVDSQGVYAPPKTSFKTNTENDDDDAALAGLTAALKSATEEITGRKLSHGESDRWKELADVLTAELKIAAARTTVSSVPAFLAEHLRRRLWKVDKKQARAEGRELPDEALSSAPPQESSKDCPDCGGSGWWYPEGPERGVTKCKHARLKQASEEDK